MGVAAYRGPFGREQAERLLWRAGFGPRKGEAAALAKLGLDGAVRSLTRPGGEKFVGPAPHDDKGRGLAPGDAWGHDHLWWLDRMVRTSRPLVERMTLVWHDWFATSLGGRRLAEADAEPEQAPAPPLAGLVRHDAARGHEGPGDAALALRHREHEVVAERELRARADGAVHARCRTGLHRARRPRAGARAHRLRQRLEARRRQRQLPLRPRAPRRRQQADLRQERHLRLAGRRQSLPPPPEARAVLRRQALALLHPGRARRRHAAVARGDVPQGLRHPADRRCDPPPPGAATPARGW